MIDAMKETKMICRHIHLPVQSGSNKVLKLMNRTYTREWFLDCVHRLKDAMPGIAISSDIIVGFPGETDSDFQQTLSLLEEVKFESSFSFKFSPRPGTPGENLAQTNAVGDKISSERLQEYQQLQKKYTLQQNLARVGIVEEVLVEGESKQKNSMLSGRTTHNRIVNFEGDKNMIGHLVSVKVQEGLPNSLRGMIIN